MDERFSKRMKAKEKHNIFQLLLLLLKMVCFMHPCIIMHQFGKLIQSMSKLHIIIYEVDFNVGMNLIFRTSKLLEIIKMPTEITVNDVFGGPDLDVLFVTSASLPFDLNNGVTALRTRTPEAGSLFIVEGIGAKGVP